MFIESHVNEQKHLRIKRGKKDNDNFSDLEHISYLKNTIKRPRQKLQVPNDEKL